MRVDDGADRSLSGGGVPDPDSCAAAVRLCRAASWPYADTSVDGRCDEAGTPLSLSGGRFTADLGAAESLFLEA